MPQALDHSLNNFIERAKAAQDMDGLKANLLRSLSDLGFDWFGYIGMDRPPGSPTTNLPIMGAPSIALNFAPDEWVDRYIEQNYWGDDPMVLGSLHTILPFRWDDALKRKKLSLRGEQVMREAAECGLRGGLTVSVLDHDGKIGLLSMSSKEPHEDIDNPLSNLVHTVHLLSIHFHAAVQNLCDETHIPTREAMLRPREVECLQWTARGKTAWEISMILKVSERTVNFHIGNAMRKLGVYNKTHAVAKLFVKGLAEL